MPFLYETHLHTSPASKCARSSVREALEFYKSLGYAGVFITNHFIDGNIGCDRALPYADKISFYFADYEEGARLEEEIGISVFSGIECSYKGTDFLVYGLDKAWFLSHPEIEDMKKSALLRLFMDEGALVIQAHPFREAAYIDHIRLFPRAVHGVEVCNASRTDFENRMAEHYADSYGLLHFAGSDMHNVDGRIRLAGMQSEAPIANEADFVSRVRSGDAIPFRRELVREDEQ